MLTLQSIWREAPAETEVCTIEGTTKNMVLRAITEGARDMQSLKETVRLCENNECAKINASKRGCHENAQTLLEIYLPIFKLMSEGGGCPHTDLAPPETDDGANDDPTSGCGGCNLCGK